MAKERTFNGRKGAEDAEGYRTVETGLPSDRFSATKQIVSSDEMGVTKDSIPENVTNRVSDAARKIKSRMAIRPDVSVEDLGGKQVGGVPLAVDVSLRNVAGARKSSPADDMSRTPYTSGEYRPKTAYGKKRTEDLFELDNTAIEQVVPIVEDCPDLKADPESTFVYNGRQQFKQVRQKKNFAFTTHEGHNLGKLPQQLLNDASLDFHTENKIVYTCGQVINPVGYQGAIDDIPASADYPTSDGAQTLPEGDAMKKGNYRPIALRITVSNGHITGVFIDEERYVAAANAITRDEANLNWQVDANNVAKTMIRIQKEMGRETTDKWTPLAYVIKDPYQFNMLLHDIEATTGLTMAAAYRAAVSSLAYQRNIVRKDGINPQRNAIKMILEGYAGVLQDNTSTTIQNLNFSGDNGAGMIFSKKAYKQGSVAGLINMFDSVGKYRTKADLLGLQRSLGLHLSQADNNIAPLRCKPAMLKALDKAHMFSTLDGNYNPFLPIFQTREIKLINPMSLNTFLVGWKNPILLTDEEKKDDRRDLTTGTYAKYMYQYTDLRKNVYKTRVQMPLIEGLLNWLLKHEGAFCSTFGEGETVIPWTFNFQAPSLLEFMFCSAAAEVAYQRNICYRDVLFAGEQSTYIWDDLKSFEELDPLYSSQLKISKYDQPLDMGKLAPDSAIRVAFPEQTQVMKHTAGHVQYFAPWTHNEQCLSGEYTIDRGFRDGDTPFYMSMPSIRDGVRHEYVDLIKSMSVKDVALSLDRKLGLIPFTDVASVRDSNNNPLYTTYTPVISSTAYNQKVALSALRYDANSDGRLIMTVDLDTGDNLDIHAKGMYCIPKELGLLDDDYTGILVVTSAVLDHDGPEVTVIAEDFEDTDTSGINCQYYNGGVAKWVTSYRVEGDALTAKSIDRSAALTATFFNFFAALSTEFKTVNDNFIAKTGLVLSRQYNNGSDLAVIGVFNPGSDHESTTSIENTVATDAQYIWTMLQRFFMPQNPFANAYALTGSAKACDPFEASFWFGVCGFLSADYTQHVLERLSEYDQLGFDFTEDVNFKDSLILR